MGMKNGFATVENSLAIPKTSKIEFLHDPIILLPGIYTQKNWNQKLKLMYTLSIAALFVITKSYKEWTNG